MKNLIIVIGLFFFLSSGFSVTGVTGSQEQEAEIIIVNDNTQHEQDDERELVKLDELPDQVIKAWDKSIYANNKVKEIYKVKRGAEILYYEIKYLNQAGEEQTIAFDADGEKVLP
ncbi:MAG: hypothetical protein ACFCUU_08965 [Cyclobacteriaceae bacterium]